MFEVHLPPTIEARRAQREKLEALAATAIEDPGIVEVSIKGSGVAVVAF